MSAPFVMSAMRYLGTPFSSMSRSMPGVTAMSFPARRYRNRSSRFARLIARRLRSCPSSTAACGQKSLRSSTYGTPLTSPRSHAVAPRKSGGELTSIASQRPAEHPPKNAETMNEIWLAMRFANVLFGDA